MYDQVMTSQDNSAAAVGAGKRKSDLGMKFEKGCLDLESFKKKFGHFNVPQRYSADPSLENWCKAMRHTYHRIQQGKPTMHNLSQDRIERLEEIGFKWKGDGIHKRYLRNAAKILKHSNGSLVIVMFHSDHFQIATSELNTFTLLKEHLRMHGLIHCIKDSEVMFI